MLKNELYNMYDAALSFHATLSCLIIFLKESWYNFLS